MTIRWVFMMVVVLNLAIVNIWASHKAELAELWLTHTESRAYVYGIHRLTMAQFARVLGTDEHQTEIIEAWPNEAWVPELVTQEERP